VTLPAGPGEPPYYWLERGGRLVSRYPVATAALAMVPLLPAIAFGMQPSFWLEQYAAAFLAATMIAFFFAATRDAAASAVFVLCTAVVPVLGHSLWQHTGAALSLAAGVWALLSLEGRKRALIVGLGAGLAVACRPVDAILAAGLLFTLLARERRWPWAALTSAAPVALVAVYNAAIFGSPFSTGYGAEQYSWMHRGLDVAEGITGILFSPARGLLVYSPVLILGAIGLWRGFRILFFSVVAFTLVMGCWWSWHGGFSPGPRMLSDTLPFLALGLPAGFKSVRKEVTIALIVASLVPNLVLSYVPPPPRAVQLNWLRSEGTWTLDSYAPIAYLR
jgi:hypothetical protein